MPQLYKGRPPKKRWDFQKQTNVTILKLCCISVISGPCRARIFPPNKTKFWRYRVTHVFREWAPASAAALHSAGGHVSMGLCPAAIFRYFEMFPWYLEENPWCLRLLFTKMCTFPDRVKKRGKNVTVPTMYPGPSSKGHGKAEVMEGFSPHGGCTVQTLE